jgi:ferredoxin
VLPYSCRNGGCLTCAAKLETDTPTDMAEQYTLEEDHIARGFRLLCVCTVKGPATFLSHQHEEAA